MRRECKMHMCNAVCATIHEGFPHLNLGSYEGFPHPNLDFIWREEAKWVWGSLSHGLLVHLIARMCSQCSKARNIIKSFRLNNVLL